MAPGEEPEQSLPEGQFARAGLGAAGLAGWLIDTDVGGGRRRRSRGLSLPQQPVLFAHDAPLLGDLPLTFEERLLPRRQITLLSREMPSRSATSCFASGRQLRRLQGGITRRRQRSIAIWLRVGHGRR